MSMSDPIADLLTRVRNAVQANHESVAIPASHLKLEICRVLKEEGFVKDYTLEESPKPGAITLTLKYTKDNAPVLQGIRRISKPSLRIYAKCTNIKPVLSGLGVSILSTSRGVMTGKQAWEAKVGGEVLCEVW